LFRHDPLGRLGKGESWGKGASLGKREEKRKKPDRHFICWARVVAGKSLSCRRETEKCKSRPATKGGEKILSGASKKKKKERGGPCRPGGKIPGFEKQPLRGKKKDVVPSPARRGGERGRATSADHGCIREFSERNP